MPFTGAADCKRAVVLTTSPAAIPSPASGRASRSTSASPVFTAIRTSSFPSSAIQSRIANAARTARSGSSSRVTGAPNSAITASPMNFSTVPPQRSSSSRRRSWYGLRMSATSSGSSCSEVAVNPTRSAKRTVMTFRSRALTREAYARAEQGRRAALLQTRGEPSRPLSFLTPNKNPALAGPLVSGRYWARTSDPQLVEPVLIDVTTRRTRRLREIATAGNRSEPLRQADYWRATGAQRGSFGRRIEGARCYITGEVVLCDRRAANWKGPSERADPAGKRGHCNR
jgi:hypothetical protein